MDESRRERTPRTCGPQEEGSRVVEYVGMGYGSDSRGRRNANPGTNASANTIHLLREANATVSDRAHPGMVSPQRTGANVNTALVISLCMAWQSPLPQIDCLSRHEAALLAEIGRTYEPTRSDQLLDEYDALDAAVTRALHTMNEG